MTLENNSYHVYNIDKETKKQTLQLATPNLQKAEELFFENNQNKKLATANRSNKLQSLFDKYKI